MAEEARSRVELEVALSAARRTEAAVSSRDKEISRLDDLVSEQRDAGDAAKEQIAAMLTTVANLEGEVRAQRNYERGTPGQAAAHLRGRVGAQVRAVDVREAATKTSKVRPEGFRVQGCGLGCVPVRPNSKTGGAPPRLPFQGYLTHKKTPTPLGPPQDPRHMPTVGS